MSKQSTSAPIRRLLSAKEAMVYLDMGHSMFYRMGIPEKVPSVGFLPRKRSFDIRDLDALIDYQKAHGTMRGFKHKNNDNDKE